MFDLHGDPYGMDYGSSSTIEAAKQSKFGSQYNPPDYVTVHPHYPQQNLAKKTGNRLHNILSPQADIALYSCATGQYFAPEVARLAPGRNVFAPSQSFLAGQWVTASYRPYSAMCMTADGKDCMQKYKYPLNNTNKKQ